MPALIGIKAFEVLANITTSINASFVLKINASDDGAGAVLMQENVKGIKQPICYYCRKSDSHQKRYSTSEKEGLTLV